MIAAFGYPARQSSAIAIVIFAIGGALLTWTERFIADSPAIYVYLSHALLWPAWLAILGQLHCYGAFLLRAAARGHEEAPTPPSGALNPFHSIAIPIVLAMVTITALCVDVAATSASAAWTVALFLTATMPALVAAVALADNAASGLDPRAIMSVIGRSGAAYIALVFAVCAGYAAVFVSIWYAHRFMVPVALAASGYAFLVAQTIAGNILYARRNELSIDTDFSPEQDAANAIADSERELEQLLTDLHRLVAVDRNRQAYARLDEYLARDRYRNDARVHAALRQFQGRGLRLEHACHYIERLVAARNATTAWAVCRGCLAEDDRFRPLSDASVIALVARAAESETDAHPAALLLDDFVHVYPDSGLHANALFRLAQLKIDRLAEPATGLELLDRIERDYPRFAGLAVFRDYARRVRT